MSNECNNLPFHGYEFVIIGKFYLLIQNKSFMNNFCLVAFSVIFKTSQKHQEFLLIDLTHKQKCLNIIKIL